MTQTSDERTTFQRGDKAIDRFKVLRFIAKGGAGEVYEAFDLELRCPVALKVVRQEVSADSVVLERFRREISLARQVTHPNVCRIFDVFRTDVDDDRTEGSLLLTMELLDGESLASKIHREGALAPETAFPIIRDMCDGLCAAHSAGVIHRDLKSANVVLAPDGEGVRAVLTDFGLAQPRTADPNCPDPLTHTGTVVGTPNYMAPEQLTGDDVTPAADVYALGVVIYETVTGVRPFRGGSDLSTAVMRLTDPPPSPRIYAPQLPLSWERVILRCLERDPQKRYQDLDELVADLSAAVEASPREAAPVVPRSTTTEEVVPPMPVRGRGPSRGFLAAVLTTIVAGVGAGFGVTQLTEDSVSPLGSSTSVRSAVSAPRVAVFPLRNLSDRPSDEWLAEALAEMISVDLASSAQLEGVSREEIDGFTETLSSGPTTSFSFESLKRIRKELGADVIIVGSYLAMGTGEQSRVRLHLRIHLDTTPQLVTVLGATDDVVSLVSDASAQIAKHLAIATEPTSS